MSVLATAAGDNGVHGAHGSTQPPSNRRMAAWLREASETLRSFESPYRFTETAAMLRQVMATDLDPARRLKFSIPYGNALLRSGDPRGALAAYEDFERLFHQTGRSPEARDYVWLQTAKAVALLRLAEQENCLLNHNQDSCLLPIQGGGVHVREEGSRGAVAALEPLLQRYPGDLRARWLLNIAYMTLGEYPHGVPAAWLIPPEVFASEHELPRFRDVAGPAGLAVDDLAGGVVVDDLNGDDWLDVMVSAWGVDSPTRYFENRGDGTFAERTREAGLEGLNSSLNLVQADFDNDGFIDVLSLRGAWLGRQGAYPNSLLRNNGDGTFTDVTESAGMLSRHPTQTAAWLDYDGDGWIDLFVGNESVEQQLNPCELYRNNGDGTFTECAEAAGVDIVGFVKGVVAGDFNNDGRPDLYLSRMDGANHLLRNDGPGTAGGWRFTDVAKAAGVTEPFQSFTCWFMDYDQDGFEDLFVSGYSIQDVGDVAADYLGLPHVGERVRMYRNRGDGTFANVTRETGLNRLLHTMGGNFGDLDNDGWPDFYVGTGDPDFSTLVPNRMFRNDGGRRFQDVTTAGGFGQLQKGHGIAFADFDHDGDQDIYAEVGGAVDADTYPNQLFENPGAVGAWIKLRLVGVRANRAAIGARVRIRATFPDGTQRVFHHTVSSGGSFGATTLRVEAGLDGASRIDGVEIDWPGSGGTERLTGLRPHRLYEVHEGEGGAREITLGSFQFGGHGDGHSHSHDHSSGHH